MNLSNSNDPIQRLSSEGYAYRKAAEMKPNVVVLIGVWLIFLPVFLFCLFNALGLIFGIAGGGLFIFVVFWVFVVVGLFSFIMLYKVSRNYFYPANYWKDED